MRIDEYLKSFIGVPYVYGGNNPLTGFDCSGAIMEGLKAFGLARGDMTAQQIYNDLVIKRPETKIIDADCLLFFGKSKSMIDHIALTLTSNPRLMIEAGGGDDTTDSIESAKKRNAFVRIRPMSSRRDFLTAIKLIY